MSEARISGERQIELFGESATLPAPVETWIDIDQLRVSDVIQPSREFVQSIQRFGVITPVVVFEDSDKLRLVDGRRRVAAATVAGLHQVPARVYTADAYLPDVVTMVLNEQRRDNPVADFSAIQRLQQRGATERDICDATGMPIGRIRRRMKLGRLHPDLFAALSEGKLSVGLAEQCAALSSAQHQDLIAVLHRLGKLTANDVRAVKVARRDRATHTLALGGLAEMLGATTTPSDDSASLAEIVAALGTDTLRQMLAELPDEPRFAAARRAIQHEVTAAWRRPLLADLFARAPTSVGSVEPSTEAGGH